MRSIAVLGWEPIGSKALSPGLREFVFAFGMIEESFPEKIRRERRRRGQRENSGIAVSCCASLEMARTPSLEAVLACPVDPCKNPLTESMYPWACVFEGHCIDLFAILALQGALNYFQVCC